MINFSPLNAFLSPPGGGVLLHTAAFKPELECEPNTAGLLSWEVEDR